MLAVLAVAAVLRPPISAVGPVISEIRTDLGLSAGAASLLTALPVVCFGVVGFTGPWVARRLGRDVALAAVLAVLAVAVVVRVTGGPAVLFAGTVAVGAAIAVGNVLLPAVVKADFPARIGLMTGVYTATLSGSAALAALVAVPLAQWQGLGWRGSLGVWGLVAALALLLWLPRLVPRRAAPLDQGTPHPARRLLGDRLALAVTGYMGFQSLGFYAVLTWLPSLLRDAGHSPQTAGALLSLATVLGLPVGLVLPAFAASLPDQRLVAVALSGLTAVGFTGLLVAPTRVTLLWVVLLGLGIGASFPLALLLVALRSSTAAATGQLSAMAQGGGYLLAAAGPFAVGVLRESSGGWTLPLLLLLACTAAQGVTGWSAGRRGVVG